MLPAENEDTSMLYTNKSDSQYTTSDDGDDDNTYETIEILQSMNS